MNDIEMEYDEKTFKARSRLGEVSAKLSGKRWVWEVKGPYGSHSFETSSFNGKKGDDPTIYGPEMAVAHEEISDYWLKRGAQALAALSALSGSEPWKERIAIGHSSKETCFAGKVAFGRAFVERFDEIFKISSGLDLVDFNLAGLRGMVETGLLKPFSMDTNENPDFFSMGLHTLINGGEDLLDVAREFLSLSDPNGEAFESVVHSIINDIEWKMESLKEPVWRGCLVRVKLLNDLNLNDDLRTRLSKSTNHLIFAHPYGEGDGGLDLLRAVNKKAHAMGEAFGESAGAVSLMAHISRLSISVNESDLKDVLHEHGLDEKEGMTEALRKLNAMKDPISIISSTFMEALKISGVDPRSKDVFNESGISYREKAASFLSAWIERMEMDEQALPGFSPSKKRI